MDIAKKISNQSGSVKCIDMHTCGEPTRIIYEGFPATSGTILDQRDQVQENHDNLRKMLMHEPRGHHDMYGALLRPHTELTETGEAHIGVLFMHNSGLSTMCGHATLALARFLVDTHDTTVFPQRNNLKFDASSRTVEIRLHAPCGLVKISAPTDETGAKYDSSRLARFISVPVYSSYVGLKVEVPPSVVTIPDGPKEITIDLAYGGAFYAIIDNKQFGSALKHEKVSFIDLATKLKRYLSKLDIVTSKLQHPDPRMRFLYGVALVDYEKPTGYIPNEVDGCESTVLVFADGELDRSPTGSCVSAQMALAHAKGCRPRGQRWGYNSFISNYFKEGAFCAEIVDELSDGAVIVQIEGQAYYTGTSQFVREAEDSIVSFLVKDIIN